MTLQQLIVQYKKAVKQLSSCKDPAEHEFYYRKMVKNKAAMVTALLNLETDIYFNIEEADILLLRQFGVIDQEKVG